VAGREAAYPAASAHSRHLALKTNVYVDAFNLYYGALKGTAYKWLNLRKLCELILPNNDIQTIRYFTDRLGTKPNDPDQPVRQQTYLRALHLACEVGVDRLELIVTYQQTTAAGPQRGS